ncbi:hypothetical protein FRC08_005141 [Ceratobasidium sp. 394]|nr:hypothetical protein FRC08_005141 [Ceratobasidium sp. 394]
MSYIDGDIENGIYYFMAVSHDHHSHVHDEPKQAVTAGSKSGDLLTVEPHEPPNYERQQWDVTRVSHDVYHIESVSSRGNWIGFERMAENEPFIISSTKRDIAIYYHPRPNGRGDWM